MNLLFFSLLYPNLRSQFLILRNPNWLSWCCLFTWLGDRDWELVELDGVVNGAGGEVGGVGAESESRDAVAVVAEELGRAGQDKRVVDGDCGVGGGGRHYVVGLLVPRHRAVRRPPAAARGLVGLSELQSSDLHGSAGYLGLRFDLGFESFSSIFVGLLIFLDFWR
ncbi:hypothetical protein DVH24_032096 [Malus domestica]|uniref:Uncharacterized protein n=1 Tax=Malus domestica TaxID=3750 RepID=A0A498J1Y3_MALDO|nr:hypothetical protein DVH24_032096 [Malus domestica]